MFKRYCRSNNTHKYTRTDQLVIIVIHKDIFFIIHSSQKDFLIYKIKQPRAAASQRLLAENVSDTAPIIAKLEWHEKRNQ